MNIKLMEKSLNNRYINRSRFTLLNSAIVFALFASISLPTCYGLQPQVQSLSEWDEVVLGPKDMLSAKDEEFVQLDAQAATSTESGSEAQAKVQAEEAFKARIEARLNAAQSHKSTISELQRKFVHSLVAHDREIIRLNELV